MDCKLILQDAIVYTLCEMSDNPIYQTMNSGPSLSARAPVFSMSLRRFLLLCNAIKLSDPPIVLPWTMILGYVECPVKRVRSGLKTRASAVENET